jgi:hypothetical protein
MVSGLDYGIPREFKVLGISVKTCFMLWDSSLYEICRIVTEIYFG